MVCLHDYMFTGNLHQVKIYQTTQITEAMQGNQPIETEDATVLIVTRLTVKSELTCVSLLVKLAVGLLVSLLSELTCELVF